MKEFAEITPEIVKKYNRSGPRYTSYPTVPMWEKGREYFSSYQEFLVEEGKKTSPISLYIHLPFCSRLCTFCGCNKVITQDQALVEQYLLSVKKELELIANSFSLRKSVQQFHLGGGTPTHLTVEQLQRLMGWVREYFDFAEQSEIALEAHPRVTTTAQLQALSALGFQRISFGVQDMDTDVQKAINRHQTLEQTRQTFYTARELGYQSINIDLVYGLPKQTQDTFQKTMEEVNRLRPDRLAVYSFAYIPNMFQSHERAIQEVDLPIPDEKIAIYVDSIQYLTSIGYQMIGMDHYAEAQDELSIAQKNHSLHRNFMGYTTLRGMSQIGVGVSAISDFGNGYFQKQKNIYQYMEQIHQEVIATERQMLLSTDDILRRNLIETLMCHCQISIPEFEKKYRIDFQTYFAKEWKQLEAFAQEEFLTLGNQTITLTRLGTLFMRNVAMIFDLYLPETSQHTHFSKTV